MIMVISQASTQGCRAGIAITLGVGTGGLTQVLATAFGVTALLQTSNSVFTGLKLFGISYLLFLAWQIYNQPPIRASLSDTRKSLPTHYQRGLILNVSNPMNALFVFFFLPPFVDEEQGSVLAQLLQLGALMLILLILVYFTISYFSEKIGRAFLHNEKFQYYLKLTSVIVITFFSAFLATSQLTGELDQN